MVSQEPPVPRGLDALLGGHPVFSDDSELKADLLQAAWGQSDPEFEELLQVEGGWLGNMRNHVADHRAEMLAPRLRRLFRFHRALMLGPSRNYSQRWRTCWKVDTPLGERSPMQAYREDGDLALDLMEKLFWAQAAGNV